MRLLTYTYLVCINEECESKSSMELNLTKLQKLNTEVDYFLITKIFNNGLNYEKLKEGYNQVKQDNILLPEMVPDVLVVNTHKDILDILHFVLFNIDIIEGELYCKKCKKCYPIKDGIPSMI